MKKTINLGRAEAVVDTLGGELISYKLDGKEYVWCGDEKYWSGHAPMMFPFVSALKEQTVKYGGQPYSYAGKHGFARKSEFELVSAGDGEAVMKLVPNGDIKKAYPYDFEVLTKHTITECGYTTEYTVTNTDKEPIQFCIGGHPAFAVDGSIEDYELIFENEENSDLYYTDSLSLFAENYKIGKRIVGKKFGLCYDDYDIDCLIAKDLVSRKVTLAKKADGSGITLDFRGFPVLVIWTPPKKKAPFLCLEPCCGIAAYTDETGNFEDKPYRKVLLPGEKYTAAYSVTVNK